MILSGLLAILAGLSLALLLWQWRVGRGFPLHRRVADASFAPAVTLLKPLKGCDETTEASLRSWLTQDYAGDVQILFGVASADDPACGVVRRLMAEHPHRDAQLVICADRLGINAKVSKLVQLQRQAKHGVILVSDADVRVPPDLLANVVAPLKETGAGLVFCFYRLANATTPAMRWEAVAINADFWSQVLQGRSLRPINFALGAVMAVRRETLEQIGGFAALTDYLADDYQLGNRIAHAGGRIEICPVVVECWSSPLRWRAVWRHQLRWARTIRVCQPAPYFLSILANPTLWPLLWLAAQPTPAVAGIALALIGVRMVAAWHLAVALTPGAAAAGTGLRAPVKDLFQAALWLSAFAGNHIEWRGERYRLLKDGRLERGV